MRKTTKLMNEIKEELYKWKDILCSLIGILNIAKMSVLSSLINRVNAIPIKILAIYFMDIKKLSLKFVWRGERPRIANTKLKEKNEWED